MVYDLALAVSTAVLTMLAVWRGRLQVSAVAGFWIVWVVVIALPSVLHFAAVATVAKERLFLATTIVNVVLSTAVLIRASRWFDHLLRTLGRAASIPPQVNGCEGSVPRWLWAMLALSLATFTLHAVLMPKIPLLELVFHPGLTANQLAEAREAAGKLLHVPLVVKYLLLWNVRVLVPIILCTFLLSGRVAAKVIVIPLLVALSAMTLEKSLPSFAIMSSALGVAIFRRIGFVSRPIIVGLIVALGVTVGLNAATHLRDFEIRRSGAVIVAPGQTGSAQGSAATAGGETTAVLQPRRLVLYPFQFVYHRILTGPSEVSYSWFEYFPDKFGGFLSGRSWNIFARSQPGFQHPANLVGLYAYHQRDPEHYLETVYAYAAFHADAWANFGLGGVIGASILAGAALMSVDLAVALSRSALTAGASGAAVSILLTTLPSGGLQAAFFAQGLLPCLMIAFLPLWRYRLHGASVSSRSLGT